MLGVTTYWNGYFFWLICFFHCIRTSFIYFQHQLINVGWTCYVELPLPPISLGFRECKWSRIIWFQSEIGHQQFTNKSSMSHIGWSLTLIGLICGGTLPFISLEVPYHIHLDI